MTLFLASIKTHLNSAKGHELHDAFDSSIRQMGGTFDRILDLSGTHKQESVRHFLLEDVFARLELEFSLAAEEFNNELIVTKNSFVAFSDPDAVYRIVGNLLTNAIRYAPDARIHLYATLVEDFLEIFVCDTGPGIHDKNKTKVFKANYRISEVEGGRGMGLAIAQELAQSIGSDLQLSSNQPSGAIFHFCIHAGDGNLIEVEPAKVVPLKVANLEGLEVLLVDDDDSVLQSTKMLLENWGCKVRCFVEFNAMIEQIETVNEQAVLVTDFHLGRADSGLEIAHYFSKSTCTEGRVIVISADRSNEIKEQVTSSGYYILHKPINPGQLASLLRTLMRQSYAG